MLVPIYKQCHFCGMNSHVEWQLRPDERLVFKNARGQD